MAGRRTDQRIFIEALSSLGGKAGNERLRTTLKWTDDKYWRLHAELFDSGQIEKGRGKGGSVILTVVDNPSADGVKITKEESKRERELYAPALKAIVDFWAKQKQFVEFIVEETAYQGRRATGGRWSRPDITLIGFRQYEYYPGLDMEVVTFEIKPADSVDVSGIYEALSHRSAATRAYTIYETANFDQEEYSSRVVDAAKAHGVGLIVTEDVSDFDKWTEVFEAPRLPIDPVRIDQFIKRTISRESREKISLWMRRG